VDVADIRSGESYRRRRRLGGETRLLRNNQYTHTHKQPFPLVLLEHRTMSRLSTPSCFTLKDDETQYGLSSGYQLARTQRLGRRLSWIPLRAGRSFVFCKAPSEEWDEMRHASDTDTDKGG